MKLPDLTEHVEHFRARVLQDALAEATSSYWLRRAEAFDRVDNERCRSIAAMCRHRAEISLIQDVEPTHALVCRTCGTPTSPWSCSCGETRVDEVA